MPHGDDPLPWERLDDMDAVYFTGGDVGALEQARRARRLVATPRAFNTLREGRIDLDALVRSAKDPGEQQAEEELDPPPDFVVSTAGKEGGQWVGEDRTTGTWKAADAARPEAGLLRRRRLVRRRPDLRARRGHADRGRRPARLARRRAQARRAGRLRRPAHRCGTVSTAEPSIRPARSRDSASSA